MSTLKRIARGLWELGHALDGVRVSWPPLRIHIGRVRGEDR